jgi:hypothetical protein
VNGNGCHGWKYLIRRFVASQIEQLVTDSSTFPIHPGDGASDSERALLQEVRVPEMEIPLWRSLRHKKALEK